MKILFLIIIIALAVSLINKKKNPEAASPTAPADLSEYAFRVAGISNREKEIIEKLLVTNDDYDLTKKQLVDGGFVDEIVYKYQRANRDIELVPDPDNEYDENAIKVIIGGILTGFVPADQAGRVRTILDYDPEISWDLVGGPFKMVREEWDDDKLKDVYTLEKTSQHIGIQVTLRYKK